MSQDHVAAAEIAEVAGNTLLELRTALSEGADPALIRKEGDRRSNEVILSLLAERFPDDAVLSEESVDDARRLAARRVWIVDPLDGTREFGEDGRTDWAVHVALVEDGLLAAGAVALPAQALTYSTHPAPSPPPPVNRAPRIAVSRTRPAAEAQELSRRLDGELVPLGSAGAKAMAILSGEIDVYFHTGGQYQWDSAAPAAVALAAGLHASRADGSTLAYGGEATSLPDLLICRRELADRVLAEVQNIMGPSFEPNRGA